MSQLEEFCVELCKTLGYANRKDLLRKIILTIPRDWLSGSLIFNPEATETIKQGVCCEVRYIVSDHPLIGVSDIRFDSLLKTEEVDKQYNVGE